MNMGFVFQHLDLRIYQFSHQNFCFHLSQYSISTFLEYGKSADSTHQKRYRMVRFNYVAQGPISVHHFKQSNFDLVHIVAVRLYF